MGTRIQRPGQWLSLTAAIVVLVLGCTTRSAMVTASGNEPPPVGMKKAGPAATAGVMPESTPSSGPAGGLTRQAIGSPMKETQAEPAQGPGAPLAGGPLAGFSKIPSEERVTPLMVAKAEPAETHAAAAPKRSAKQLADIYFAFDMWSLSPEGQRHLNESADVLRQNPAASLVIEGYCDERGSREYNLVLGEKRAEETSRFLQALGVTNPVHVTSYGKERQVCPELGEACYWKNRRAHLVVEETKP